MAPHAAQVAYDIAMRAQRFGVAVAATELAVRHLGPPPLHAAASAAAAAAAGNALHAAVALTRDCIAGRLAAAAQTVPRSANGGRRAAAAGAAGDGPALPQATGAAVLRDLRWLCCRLSDVVAAPLAAQAQVNTRVSHDIYDRAITTNLPLRCAPVCHRLPYRGCETSLCG